MYVLAEDSILLATIPNLKTSEKNHPKKENTLNLDGWGTIQTNPNAKS
jgi:hypothetical protein